MPSPSSRTGPSGRISVVIPARNEGATIGRTLAALHGRDVHEIIVADGQSADDTVAIVRGAGARVVEAPPGRGSQLNAGADVATGDLLLFLHADTRVPEGFETSVRSILARPRVSAGAFRLAIDAPHRSLRLVESLVNWRSVRWQRPYGDQGLFVSAATFHDLGGYAAIPLLEDLELTRRLRRRGRIEIAPLAVTTSARRWLACGIWRTTLQNQVCIAAWRLGVSPQRIAAWRRRALERRLGRDSIEVEADQGESAAEAGTIGLP